MEEVMSDERYAPWEMTEKWQRRWKDENVFVAHQDSDRPKYYCYEFPPFPSGSLHMGHVRNYGIGDATARYKRLMGYNVLYAQGFDSMGQPVEEAALKARKTPVEWLDYCTSKMADELLHLGLSYDHTRFISYHDPEYYRWTQWIFLKLYEAGMIYRDETWVEWCDTCKTAVAAELIENGCCWRCGSTTNGKKLFQWFINIKKIAPELWDNLGMKIEFSKSAEAVQKNWIGRKEGYYVTLPVEDTSLELEVFTTTIELLHGVTYIAVAPENPTLTEIVKGTPHETDSLQAVKKMCTISRVERLKMSHERGVFTDRYCIHPLTEESIPIFIAPFVVAEFGTGVVFGCPAHGKNDFNFARAMDLPIIPVVKPQNDENVSQDEPYLGEGILINSGPFDGMKSKKAAEAISNALAKNGRSRKGIAFSSRNWCISRQRYWSVPIPIVYCNRCGTVPVKEDDLPVELPVEGIDLSLPGNPLEKHEEFVNCICPDCGGNALREASTITTFMNSSWGYLRYCNIGYRDAMFDPEAVDYWMPCNIGFGGSEQVNVGNFYFRVVFGMLNKIGVIEMEEPWSKFVFNGLVIKDGQKMSKSLGNVVEPHQLIEIFGVDAVRFHTLSMARPENDVNWSDEEMQNSYCFLSDLWDMSQEIHAAIGNFQEYDYKKVALKTRRQRTFIRYIEVARKKIIKNYEDFEFQRVCKNLALFNEKIGWFWQYTQKSMTPENKALLHKGIKALLVLMNPVAPHITEELWEQFGNSKMLCVSYGILKTSD
jgi:leucyl-tRNA synthetase